MTRLREMLLAVALVLVTTFVAAAPAWAQQGGASGGGPAATQGAPATGGQRSFLPPAGGAQRATEPRADAGFIDRAYAWLTAVQGDFNQRLARAVRELKTGDPWVAIIAIAGLSFMYGVLHAIGPGHGKAIVSSYVLASDRTVRRGIALSFLAALFQAISALVLVALLVGIFNATGLAVKATEAWLETASWGLVVLVGVWLLWVQIGRLRAARRAKAEQASARHDGHHHDHAHSHGIGHAHAHAHAHASSHTHSHAHVGAAGGAALAHAHAGSSHTHRHAPAHGSHVHHHHGHDHRHAHAGHATGTGTQAHAHHHHEHHHHDGDCCGHAHMPAPKDLEGPWSWRKAVPLAFAIGIRPCTGAIAVLIFALSQGLVWAGVFATFAMAIGTAITVSVLAALAAGSRDLAVKLGGGDGGWGASIRSAAGIGGSLAVIGLGLMLFLGSLRAAAVF